MSTDGINRMLGEAVISDHFRAGLLTNQREELMRDPRFQLEADETAALLSIEAETLQQFAAAVECLIEQRKAAGAGGDVTQANLTHRRRIWTPWAFLRQS